MPKLKDIIKLTKEQYEYLEAGCPDGPLGDLTGLDSDVLYLIEDNTQPVLTVNNTSPDVNGNVSLTIPTNYVTTDTAQTIGATKTINNDSSIIFTYTNSANPTYGGIKAKYLTDYDILKPTYVKQGYGGYMVTDISAYTGDTNSFIRFNSNVQPASNNTLNLGNSSQKFANIYGINLHGTNLLLSGIMKNGSGNYGISIPTTTSYTANKTLATTEDFSVTTTSGSESVTANGNTLTFGSNAFNSTAIPTTYVSSVNGSSGDITNIATLNDLPTNPLTYSSTGTYSVAGTNKTTYTYAQTTIYSPNGLIMGGSAAAAGLVTRGICGVSTPSTGGACNKDNLFLNYDSDNTYRASRQVIIQAGSAGTHYGSNLYQYAAARGDAVKGWVESQATVTATASKFVNRDASGNANAVAFNLCSASTSTANATISYDSTNECIKFTF